MKIAIIVSSTQLGGGAEHSSILLAQGLSDEYDVKLITYYTVEESYDTSGVKHVCLGIPYSSNLFGKLLNLCWTISQKLKKHMEENTYVLVIVNGADSIVSWGISGLAQKQDWYAVLRNHRTVIPSWVRHYYLYTVHKATKVVSISKGLLSNHHIHNNNGFTIPNPIDIESNNDSSLHTMTKVPLFESNTKNIVTIGRLEHIKNPLYLLELFHMLYTSDDTYRLIMVGDGSMKNVVEKYISTNELQAVVHLTGRVVDVSPYLHAADLFLLTSRAETFGRVIVEAMAAGCPVAAVNCPTGPAEIIADTVTQEVIELPCLAKFGILLSVDHMKDNCALIEQFMRSTELRKKYELVGPIRSKLYTKSDIIEQWKNFIENR